MAMKPFNWYPVDFNPPTTSTVNRDQNKAYKESYGPRETAEKTKDMAIASMQEVYKYIRLDTRYAVKLS